MPDPMNELQRIREALEHCARALEDSGLKCSMVWIAEHGSLGHEIDSAKSDLAKLESSSRLDMLTEKEIDRLGDQRRADIKALDIADGLAEGYIDGFKSGLRFARDRFSAPPAIDVEKIMMAVQDSYLAAGVHMGIKSPLAADLRSRLLSLLSPGKGEGVTVAENKAPRS